MRRVRERKLGFNFAIFRARERKCSVEWGVKEDWIYSRLSGRDDVDPYNDADELEYAIRRSSVIVVTWEGGIGDYHES